MNKILMIFAVIILTMIYGTMAFAKPGFEGIEDARFERMRKSQETQDRPDAATRLEQVNCKRICEKKFEQEKLKVNSKTRERRVGRSNS